MAADAWVTAGAPLESGDGWRVWSSWTGDLTPADPVVREVGGGAMTVVPGGFSALPAPPGTGRRYGVRELRLEDATEGALYELKFPELARPVVWRTLPTALPPEGVNILVASCFWLNGDVDGYYADAMLHFVRSERPAFKILTGDQLYMDVWGPRPSNVTRGLAERYARYWSNPPYRDVLSACPTLVCSDDHEYWNDFPRPQLQVPYSLLQTDKAFRDARALYDTYQRPLNPQGSLWSTLRIGPVSLFVTEMRYDRDTRHLMSTTQWDALERWVHGLAGPGLLVIAQPLLKEGGSRTDRTITDFADDANRLVDLLEGSVEHDILLITGDIHTGRVSTARFTGQRELFEFCTSPASRVTPRLEPLGARPSKLPTRLRWSRGRQWSVLPAYGTEPTIDDNIGLIRLSPGTNRRVRVTLQLLRVRSRRRHTNVFGVLKAQPRGARKAPIGRPIELQLR